MAALFLSTPGKAATVTVPCGADTSIFELAPENNLGGMSFMPVGRLATGARARALLRFDLAQHLPQDAFIRAVRLDVEVLEGDAENAEFSLHRMLRPWGEGDKSGGSFEDDFFGAPASDGEATWLACLHAAMNWTEPGCSPGTDYVAQRTADEMVDQSGPYAFTSSTMLNDVAMWAANPGTNFGWLLKAGDELRTDTGVFFASREDLSGGARLVIDYEVIARPRLQGARVNGSQFQFQFFAEANRRYVVQHGSSPGADNWQTLTEIQPSAQPQTVLISDASGAGARFYRVHSPE